MGKQWHWDIDLLHPCELYETGLSVYGRMSNWTCKHPILYCCGIDLLDLEANGFYLFLLVVNIISI